MKIIGIVIYSLNVTNFKTYSTGEDDRFTSALILLVNKEEIKELEEKAKYGIVVVHSGLGAVLNDAWLAVRQQSSAALTNSNKERKVHNRHCRSFCSHS